MFATVARVRRFAADVLLGLAILALALPGLAREPSPSPPTVALSDLPPEAVRTLHLIRQGGPFPYRKDGVVFQNREKRLPPRQHGYYLEYTVPTPNSPDRGARRIVAGKGAGGDVRTSGEYYYTADHYRSFRRVLE